MKIVKSNEKKFKIYGEELTVLDQLPVGVYTIQSAPFEGPFLEKVKDIEIKEPKIYGGTIAKADKIIRRFKNTDKKIGAILSGKKGLGKSLTANVIAKKCIEELKIPVILVTCAYPFLEEFINSIDQEIMVLFDEFEKRFDDDDQKNLLTFFDGNAVSQKKRLYVITCNRFDDLNQYFMNRPGRFHYHFRFTTPTMEEITEYLVDNIKPEYADIIGEVAMFGVSTDINFDCLNAIVSEVNSGENFKDAIKDLNIMKFEIPTYKVSVRFDSGIKAAGNVSIDTFVNAPIRVLLYPEPESDFVLPVQLQGEGVVISFNASNISINHITSEIIMPVKDVNFEREYSLQRLGLDLDDEDDNKKVEHFDKFYTKVSSIEITKASKGTRYDFY